jgi:hypothetical protein
MLRGDYDIFRADLQRMSLVQGIVAMRVQHQEFCADLP